MKMLETSEMVVSVKLLSCFVQKLQDTLRRKAAKVVTKGTNFEEEPSGSESEFEGVTEPTIVAVGNLESNTTEEDLLGFFDRAGHATYVKFLHGESAAMVEFGTAQEANEAVKLNGEDLLENSLYITPNGNNRRVFFASNFSPNETESTMKKTVEEIFKKYGTLINVYVPPKKRFAYLLVEFFAGMEKLFDDDDHEGVSFRPASLKGSFGEEHFG